MAKCGGTRGHRWGFLPGGMATLLSSLACSACVVIPIGMFTESPFSAQVLARLRNADSTEVRQTLGEPQLVKASGRYWFYTHSRETWGIIGGTSSAVLTDDDWLAVQFDEAGRVTFIESNDLKNCLSNGICLDGSAPTVQDISAKAHRVAADECAVYLFLESLPWPLATGTTTFRLDGRTVGVVTAQTYLLLTRPPGEVKLAAYDLAIGTHCAGGEKLYIRAVKKRDWSWDTGEDLAPVSNAEGEAAIAARRLALPD